jgi:hypothetical protein
MVNLKVVEETLIKRDGKIYLVRLIQDEQEVTAEGIISLEAQLTTQNGAVSEDLKKLAALKTGYSAISPKEASLTAVSLTKNENNAVPGNAP